MPHKPTWIRKRAKAIARTTRELLMIARGLLSTDHVVQVHIVPMRRCNLACTYCNEYDDFSKPVPTDVMLRRIDALAGLGASLITISGGEPLLNPELEEVIKRIRHHGILAGLITNGYLLTADRIDSLNRAGLDHLQISIDNVTPDEVSKKSLKVLDKKLQVLREYAEFHVNINSVVGSGVNHPEDALTIAKRAIALGFSSTVGIIHNGKGQLRPLAREEKMIFDAVRALGKRSYARFNDFQVNLAHGKPNEWKCRSGARYLYICEDGLVHWCSQQRGYPGVPVEQYTIEDVRREFLTKKPCAPNCTVSCAHQTSLIDFWRAPQTLTRQPRKKAAPTPLPVLNNPGLEPEPAMQDGD